MGNSYNFMLEYNYCLVVMLLTYNTIAYAGRT